MTLDVPAETRCFTVRTLIKKIDHSSANTSPRCHKRCQAQVRSSTSAVRILRGTTKLKVWRQVTSVMVPINLVPMSDRRTPLSLTGTAYGYDTTYFVLVISEGCRRSLAQLSQPSTITWTADAGPGRAAETSYGVKGWKGMKFSSNILSTCRAEECSHRPSTLFQEIAYGMNISRSREIVNEDKSWQAVPFVLTIKRPSIDTFWMSVISRWVRGPVGLSS